MNKKLHAIAAKAADNLQAYVAEHEDKILEAWNAAEQEAQDNESKPKFKLGFSIVLDLENDAMETALSWSVRFKASSVVPIPDMDADQSKLPLDS